MVGFEASKTRKRYVGPILSQHAFKSDSHSHSHVCFPAPLYLLKGTVFHVFTKEHGLRMLCFV